MFYVLLVQLTARVAVKVDTGRTRLDTVQVTPARGIKAQGRTKLRFAEVHLPLNARDQILKDTDFQRTRFTFSAEALRETLGQKCDNFFTAIQLRLIFHEIS